MDVRLVTFLQLCKQMNYRATAEALHVTQPTVTQHIQSLEQEFNCKLFTYSKKRLAKTGANALLQEYAHSIQLNEQMVHRRISSPGRRMLQIGSTRTLSEFFLKEMLGQVMLQSDFDISLVVAKHLVLLDMLKSFRLDVAVLDSPFSHDEFDSELIAADTFVGICAPCHPFAGKCISPAQLLNENILLQDEGVSSRDVFDQMLYRERIPLSQFPSKSFINNATCIRYLVENNYGISFTFGLVSSIHPGIATFTIARYEMPQEYNFVFLKESNVRKSVLPILKSKATITDLF